MQLEEYEATFVAIAEEWNHAERDIKLAEQVCQDVILPAVNELRYAGRRLCDALVAAAQGKSEAEISVFLEEARLDCHRARHDAIDGAISYIGEHLALMEQHLGFDAILKAYPNFPAFIRKYLDAQSLIASSREARDKRGEIYAALEGTNFPAIVSEYTLVLASEDLMTARAARGRLSVLIARLVIGCGILAALIIILVFIAP